MLRLYESDKFLDLVAFEPNTGCWLWLGPVGPNGYGQTQFKGGRIVAHRLSHILHIGPIPDGLFVCHKCDVRSCVNPDHLFLGTNSDNMKDMWRKKRRPTNLIRLEGEQHPNSRLTADKVIHIRKLAENGVLYRSIAAMFGVSRIHIGQIVLGRYWKNV